MKNANRLMAGSIWVALCLGLSLAGTVPPEFTDALVAGGLVQPTLLEAAPDGRIFVSEKPGRLRIIKNGTLLPAPFVTLSVNTIGDGGLLGVTVDPDFQSNRFIYLFYTSLPGPHNKVSRFTASISNPDVAEAGSEVVLIELPTNLGNIHYGGSIRFGMDGKLYISTGDGYARENSQTLSNPFGKLLRIEKDGAIPADNPFLGSTTGVNRAIFALGLRNPFSFGVQRAGGRIFINDPGRDNWAGEGEGMEEINELLPGANYGWPLLEGYTDTIGFLGPIHAHPTYDFGCAITGGDFYDPPVPKFPMTLYGSYFFADFCGGTIRRFDPATRAVSGFATGLNRPTGVKVAPDGALYYLEYGTSNLRRITAKSFPVILEAESAATGGTAVSAAMAGYTGAGYLEALNASGDWVEFSGTLTAATAVPLTLRYANGGGSAILVDVSLNGVAVASGVPLPPTGGAATWGEVTGTVQLHAGANMLRITTVSGGLPHFDHLRAY